MYIGRCADENILAVVTECDGCKDRDWRRYRDIGEFVVDDGPVLKWSLDVSAPQAPVRQVDVRLGTVIRLTTSKFLLA